MFLLLARLQIRRNHAARQMEEQGVARNQEGAGRRQPGGQRGRSVNKRETDQPTNNRRTASTNACISSSSSTTRTHLRCIAVLSITCYFFHHTAHALVPLSSAQSSISCVPSCSARALKKKVSKNARGESRMLVDLINNGRRERQALTLDRRSFALLLPMLVATDSSSSPPPRLLALLGQPARMAVSAAGSFLSCFVFATRRLGGLQLSTYRIVAAVVVGSVVVVVAKGEGACEGEGEGEHGPGSV